EILVCSYVSCAWGGEINAPAGQMVGGATSNRGLVGARQRRADGIGRGGGGVASAGGSWRGAPDSQRNESEGFGPRRPARRAGIRRRRRHPHGPGGGSCQWSAAGRLASAAGFAGKAV